MHFLKTPSLWALPAILGSPALKAENAKLGVISTEANE
jgi:hypothetical protein